MQDLRTDDKYGSGAKQDCPSEWWFIHKIYVSPVRVLCALDVNK